MEGEEGDQTFTTNICPIRDTQVPKQMDPHTRGETPRATTEDCTQARFPPLINLVPGQPLGFLADFDWLLMGLDSGHQCVSFVPRKKKRVMSLARP